MKSDQCPLKIAKHFNQNLNFPFIVKNLAKQIYKLDRMVKNASRNK